MSLRYALAPILDIRRRRQEDAERSLAQARQQVAIAQNELERCRETEKNYEDWCAGEITRLYEALESDEIEVTNQEIVDVREQIAWNASQLVHFQKRTEEAAANVSKAREAVTAAEVALQKAVKEVLTIEEHKAAWTEEVRAGEAVAEESELEEVAVAQFFRQRAAA